MNELPNAAQAAFNATQNQHDPTCLPKTRVGVLNEIRAWADGQDERRIYWLNGLAGTGKSTIARTIAREYFERGRLGASFFFSKGGGDVGNAGKFFTTIALQLANKSSSLKSYISSAVSENNDIKNQSLRDQWHQLILRPLSRLDGNPSWLPYILIIDALDECEGENNIRAILQLLAEAWSLRTAQLRVFLTSRPEIAIRHGFYQIPDAERQDFVLHRISPSIVDYDIGIFLEYNFKLIGEERSLDPAWPGENIIKRLVQNAGGLFIWAATACRFIREGRNFAEDRLAIVLKDYSMDDSSTDSSLTDDSLTKDRTIAPEAHLDKIYITVLKNSVQNYNKQERKKWYKLLRETAGSIVLLYSPLSAFSLAGLLHIHEEDIIRRLHDLCSILDIPEERARPIRLHHPSFRDFILDKKRCGNSKFWVDEKQAHRILADNCIQLMSTSLKQDICGVDAPGVLVADIESTQVEQYLPAEVQYACTYWIEHLQKSGAQLYNNDQVHQFLNVHTLHWLEALGWMRKISKGIRAITSLESIALVSLFCSI